MTWPELLSNWLTLDPADRTWLISALLLILSLITVIIWWRERHE